MDSSAENRLETILRLAANEPARRPEFCALLLASTVYVLGSSDQPATDGEVHLAAGSQIQLQHWEKSDGKPVIPFFSSLERLQQSIAREETYMALPARALFEITQGATLFLNPKSDYGKEFLPQEVQHLLAIGVSQAPIARVVEKETKVMLGQPAQYPAKMVDSLIQLFSMRANVKKAYLALMHDPSVDAKPHLVIGIEADGDLEQLIREAGNVASDTAPQGEAVDLYRVQAKDPGLSQYFIHQTRPFYEQRWGGKLKAWLGMGRQDQLQ